MKEKLCMAAPEGRYERLDNKGGKDNTKVDGKTSH